MKFFKTKLIATYVIYFCVFIVSSTTYGQKTKLHVVYTEWFPYTYEENGKASGFEIEIFKAIMENMNINAEFVPYPWGRCLYNLEQGEADALISMLNTPEREKYAYYPEEYISISKTMFFTTTGNDIKFNGSYEELKGYNIGVIIGFSYGDAFDKAEYLNKENVVDTNMLIKKILRGRNDLAAENQAVVNGIAFKMGVKDKIKFIEPPIHTQKLYVGFSKAKGLKKLCHDFSKSLSEFKKSEPYKDILGKYGINYWEMSKQAE